MAKLCTRSSSSNIPYLPEEILLTEIFPRLPVKGVGKCRCLSKEWRTKLSTSEFINMHRNPKINQQENTLLLETLGEAVLCTMPSRTSNNSFLSKRIDLQFTYEGFQIENTCNGLVLLHNERCSEMVLVNPVTREQLTIPKSPLVRGSYGIISPALGYDSSAMDYKIAYLDDCKEAPFVHVYSVKTGVWKSYNFPHYGTILCPVPGKVVLNGVIHWLVPITIPRTDTSPGRLKYVISSFELAGEVFGKISHPGKTLSTYGPHVLGECLGIVNTVHIQGGASVTDLWVMKKYGEHSSWVKLATWQFERFSSSRYEPVCLNGGDEEVLMRTDARALVVFNPKDKNAIDVVVDGSEGPFTAAHTFVESLVSPIPAAIVN